MQIYDGYNVEALTLLDRNSLNYNTAFNGSIISSANVIHVHLYAGSKDTGGINFLLFWTQVDAESTAVKTELETVSKYNKF